ncbi:MAG: hypothetical protein QUS12_04310, partial [Methanosarcina sp.]|nr:hypothetical protein [Methanosarcina sp.]
SEMCIRDRYEGVAPADEIPNMNESYGINLSGNEEEIAGNEITSQTPGFTSIMVVLGLLLVLIFNRS